MKYAKDINYFAIDMAISIGFIKWFASDRF